MDSSCFVSLSLFLRTPSPQQEGGSDECHKRNHIQTEKSQ